MMAVMDIFGKARNRQAPSQAHEVQAFEGEVRVVDLAFSGNPGFNIGDCAAEVGINGFVERTADTSEYFADIGPSRVT
jgi:hypothetical protein